MDTGYKTMVIVKLVQNIVIFVKTETYVSNVDTCIFGLTVTVSLVLFHSVSSIKIDGIVTYVLLVSQMAKMVNVNGKVIAVLDK